MIRIPPVAIEFQFLLTEEEFTKETLVRESEAILNREKDTAFIRIQFGVSLQTLQSRLPDGVETRGIWTSMKRRWNTTSVRYGELISLKGNAVLRLRDGLSIEMIILRGENPLEVSHAGRKAQFVHFGLLYNYSKSAVLAIDASAAVPRGEWDTEFAKFVVQAAQRALNAPLAANLTMGEDRFCFFTGKFVNALLFDLDAPPSETDWYRVRRAECAVNRLGHGYCAADRQVPGQREKIDF